LVQRRRRKRRRTMADIKSSQQQASQIDIQSRSIKSQDGCEGQDRSLF
jgi:hypothetical protein